MNKGSFKRRYNISDSPPADPTKSEIRSSTFASALAEFINDNFRAAAESESLAMSSESVLVSIEHTAFFIKNLLCSIFGRTHLRISIVEESDALVITALASEPLPISCDETNALIKNARDAGFLISLCECGFKMQLSFSDAKNFSVYTPPSISGIRPIISRLTEICFNTEKSR